MLAAHVSFDRHGGANYSKHLLAQHLEERGYNVTIHTFNFQDPNHVPLPHDYDLVEMDLGAHGYLDGGPKFVKWMADRLDEYDVLHVYIPGPIPLAVLAKEAARSETPVVATLNGYTPFCSNSSMMSDGCWQECSLRDKIVHGRSGPQGKDELEAVSRHAFNHVATVPLMNRADGYMCLSPAVADIYADIGVNRDLLDVVPNMVDPGFDADTEAAREPVAADGAGPVELLYAGRLDPGKGVKHLLDAVPLMDTDREFRVSVVGDDILGFSDDGLDGYRDRADELGVGGLVEFHGWVDYLELPAYYASADVFVHPGVWPEPFGRTIIEAMSHGLPVACSDAGAPPWVAGSAGVTFPPGDPVAMADALSALVDAPELRAALSANSELEVDRFDPEAVTSQVIEFYRGAGA